MTARPDASVLIVEDEALVAMLLSDMLEDMGLRVCDTADTTQRAVELAVAHRPDLVLMDVRLKANDDGIAAAVEIHRRLRTPIIFVTGSRDPDTVERIRSIHPSEILFKPILLEQLRAAVTRALA